MEEQFPDGLLEEIEDAEALLECGAPGGVLAPLLFAGSLAQVLTNSLKSRPAASSPARFPHVQYLVSTVRTRPYFFGAGMSSKRRS